MKKKEFYLTLVLCELSLVKQRQIIFNYDSINDIVNGGYDKNISQILTKEEYEKLVDVATSGNVARHLEGLKINGIGIISIDDNQYPECLRNIHEPPTLLYYKGNIEILNTDCIAIIIWH